MRGDASLKHGAGHSIIVTAGLDPAVHADATQAKPHDELLEWAGRFHPSPAQAGAGDRLRSSAVEGAPDSTKLFPRKRSGKPRPGIERQRIRLSFSACGARRRDRGAVISCI
jgi:hypothetical protein